MRSLVFRFTPRKLLITAVLTVIAVGTMLGLRIGTAQGFPIPPLTYSIIATSGTHHASILNLPIGYVGTYQAPIPVDVNGDLLPDALVSVNLVNVNGVFNNPPNIGAIIAPNIQIDRMITAPVLGQPSPPLKIEVQLKINDSGGGAPTVLSFGYDTGVGGSMPTYYHALVGGLNTFFNPLQAVVDTTGTIVGLQPNINGLGLAPVGAPYQGPLHVIGGISTGSTNANLDFGFRPFPRTVTVGYGSDSAGQHVTYAHNYSGEVDLSGGIQITNGASTTTLNSRIDRLPQNLALDFNNGAAANSGSVDMRSTPNGRLSDVGLTLATTAPGTRPLNANIAIDALPAVMHADWSLPQGGPDHASFCAPAAPSSSPCTAPQGAGIGAIQAKVTNYAAGASPIVPYVPDQQQFLNFQQGGTNPSDPDMLITARVERIRNLNFSQSGTGIDATAQLGDGELPLLAHFVTDGRGGSATGPFTEATATVTPLPATTHLNFQMPPPGATNPPPTVLTYNASTPVDITGKFTSFGAGSGGACGTNGTICASLRAFHIPSQLVTTIVDQPDTTQINVDSSSPGSTAVDAPDFIADATLGQSDNNHPIVAHASLLGFPRAITIFTHQGVNQTLDAAEFHACDWQVNAPTPGCATGQTEGAVGDLSFNIHNWVNRPANLPLATPTTPNFATVVARGISSPADNSDVNFEATGDVKSISELDYRNAGGVSGVRVHAGGGQGFSAHLDAGNLLLAPGSDRVNALVDAVVPTLPSQMDVCFRMPNRGFDTTGAAFTVPCEDNNPFSDPGSLATTPLTFSYRGSSDFNILTTGKVVDEGPDSITDGKDTSTTDDRTYQGVLNVTNLPQNMTANVQMPPEGQKGAIRALYCSGSVLPAMGSCPTAAPGDPQVNVDFSASVTDSDLVCKDPRVPAAGNIALCASGTLANLPSHALVTYDPTQPNNNFVVQTSGDKHMSITGTNPCPWGSSTPTGTTIPAGSPQCFEVSSVSRDTTTGKPDILIGDGNIADLPQSVTGTLFFPQGGQNSSPNIDITANPPLGHVDAVVRNFIAPNPILQTVPDRTTGFGAPTQQVTFFQRGDAFEGEAHIGDVKGFGFRTVSDADGNSLDTQAIRAEFGGNQTIRAYADIEPNDSDRIIGDITLNNVPAGINLCIRGANNHPGVAPGPGQATFCDTGDSNIGVNDGDGSFQFVGQGAPGAPHGLGVDGFVRYSKGGNSSILSGRVHIDGIPDVVEGTFPSSSDKGDLDVAAFNKCSTSGASGAPACGSGQNDGDLVPTGISHINVNLASFDLNPVDAGFTGTPPFPPLQNTNPPFPVVVPTNGHQYLEATLHNSAFQVRGNIGPDSKLQQVEMLQQHCAAPPNNPSDYPPFPDAVNGTTVKYKCIAGNFIQNVPNAPLDVGFLDQTPDGKQISFLGGLTDLPNHIQMTLSDAGDQKDSTLTPCAAGMSASSGCVPPLIRFDQPANSTLYGTLSYGQISDLVKMLNTAPVEKTVNVFAVPNPTSASNPWNDWADSDNTSGNGVRAMLGVNGGGIAAIAGLQIAVPQSLTIDQPLGWSRSDSSNPDDYWSASDTKFHFIVRNASGDPVQTLGEAAMLVNDFDDGYQIIGGNPCLSIPLALRGGNPGDCPDFGFGFPIPGEVGVGLYRRENSALGKNYIQIDGRVSRGSLPLNIGVRLFGIGQQSSIGRMEGQVLDVPTTADVTTANGNEPTFRLKAELVGQGSAPPTGGQNPQPSGSSGSSVCSSAFFCAQVDAKVQSVFAKFDFRPSGGAPARLVDAVINQAGSTKNGMEVTGYAGLDESSAKAPITATGFIDINPLNIYIDAGIPIIAGADVVLQSEIQANLAINDSTDFFARENLLHIQTASEDQAANTSRVGPLNMYIYLLHAEADLLFVPLLTIDFVPTSVGPSDQTPGFPSGPAQLSSVYCNNFGTALASGLVLPALPNNSIGGDPPLNGISTDVNDPTDILIWPFGSDPRFHLGGVLGPVIDILQHFAAPFFCLMGASNSDIQLMRGPDQYPSDPVGGLSANPPTGTTLINDTHPVPGAHLDPTIMPVTPPPPPPATQVIQTPTPVTITSPVSLCGEHDFGDLTIKSTVTVATAANNADFMNSGPTCPAGSEGNLTIQSAGHTVTLTAGGTIDGSKVNGSTTPFDVATSVGVPSQLPTGNGGGAHVGAGGNGAIGVGGSSYGSTDFTNPLTESGEAGSTASGGTAGGRGGGIVSIDADTVQVDPGSQISVDAGAGVSAAAACTSADNPGGGGGSGGGIAIQAVEVDNNGLITARGGNGGSSGIAPGGGGGSGVVKIIAPIVTGGNPITSAGVAGGVPNAGTGTCPTSTSAAGGAFVTSTPDTVQSSAPRAVVAADGTPKFWNVQDIDTATASLPALPQTTTVPYVSAASNGAANSLQTYLCAAYLSQSDYDAATAAHPNTSLTNLFTMPQFPAGDYTSLFHPNQAEPCGTNSTFVFNAPTNSTLAQTSVAANRTSGNFTIGTYADSTSNLNGAYTGGKLPDGYYGLYTVVAVPTVAGMSCSDPSNTCVFQQLPAAPQTVIGIDNGPPTLGFSVNGSNTSGWETNNGRVLLNISAQANEQLSGLQLVQCSNDNVAFHTCGPNGPYEWDLTSGDGTKTVYVEAINNAGAVTEQQLSGLLDTTPPTAHANVTGGVKVNGWYQVPPAIQLVSQDALTGMNQTEAFAYRFDDGSERPSGSDTPCPGPPTLPFPFPPPGPATCTIPQSVINDLSDGTHTLYFTGIDSVGNRLGPDDDSGAPVTGAQPMMSLTLMIDHEAPHSALLSVPAAPDGANGWFATRPWVVISAVDQVGGSGLVPGAGDNPVAGVSYYLDGVLHAAPAFPNPPQQPFQLTQGEHDVCWFAQDVAGNLDVSGTSSPPTAAQLATKGQCQHFKVDSQAPTTTISVPPINGAGGWYTSTVPVTLVTTDPTPGSGTALVDPHDLCGPPSSTPSGASGTCVSIDHSAFMPYLSTFPVGEGTHDIRAFSVDAAGNKSPIVELPINVDLSPPVASAVVVPGASAQNGWWRSAPYPNDQPNSPPQIVLRAVDGDQNSGVAHLQYQVVNLTTPTPSWTDYTGPFNVPEGVNTVNYRAIDNAGLVEPTQTLSVPVDVTPPVVVATSPTPAIWLQLLDILGNILGLSPPQAQLNWTVSDNLSPHVHITVLVFNVAGAVVRQLDGGTYNTTPGVTLHGSTAWDGRDFTITGILPVGLYYYRVVATDDAGNTSQSGESAPIQIKASLGLL